MNTGGTLGTDAIRVAADLPHRASCRRSARRWSTSNPIHNRPPTAQTFDVVDADEPGLRPAVHRHRQPLQVEGLSRDRRRRRRRATARAASTRPRTAQANRLLTWINSTVIPAAGDPDVLLLGDFNSYAKEDPITALKAGGYTDLARAPRPGRLLLPVRRPARAPRLRLCQREPRCRR